MTTGRLALERDPRRVLLVIVVRVLMQSLFRLRVRGSEHIPKTGAALLVANHQSIADSFLLYVFAPRSVRFMAKEELFLGPWGRLARWLGGFPVRRGGSDRQAIRTALDLLADGECVAMFPEGSRSLNGELQRAYPGAGLLGVRSSAPVVPAAIVGTRALRTWTGFVSRPAISVTIGEPSPVAHSGAARVSSVAAADLMMERIAALLPLEMRGVYAEQLARAE